MNWLTDFLGYTAGAVLAILPIVNPLGAVPLVINLPTYLKTVKRKISGKLFDSRDCDSP